MPTRNRHDVSGPFLARGGEGAQRVDTARLAQVVGEPIAKADAQFVRDATGFAIGGVAPVGHTGELLRFVEASLAAHARIWAAAGHPNTVFPLTYAELLRITRAAAVDVALLGDARKVGPA